MLAGIVTPAGRERASIFLAFVACLDLQLERLMPSLKRFEPQRISLNNRRHYITEGFPNVPDGTVLPSWTTVLSAMAPIGKIMALKAWRKRIGEEEAKRRTRLAANRGTWLHGVIEDWFNDKDIENHLEKAPEWQPYFLMLEPFLSGETDGMALICEEDSLPLIKYCHGFKDALLVESAVAWYDPDLGIGAAGTVDMFATTNRGLYSLPDWKSSFKVKPPEQLSDYKKQLGGYSLSIEQMYDESIDEAWNAIACYDPEDKESEPSLQLMRLDGAALVCEQSVAKDTVQRFFTKHYPGGRAFTITADKG